MDLLWCTYSYPPFAPPICLMVNSFTQQPMDYPNSFTFIYSAVHTFTLIYINLFYCTFFTLIYSAVHTLPQSTPRSLLALAQNVSTLLSGCLLALARNVSKRSNGDVCWLRLGRYAWTRFQWHMIRHQLNGYSDQRVSSLPLASSVRNCLNYAVLKGMFPRRASLLFNSRFLSWSSRYVLSSLSAHALPRLVTFCYSLQYVVTCCNMLSCFVHMFLFIMFIFINICSCLFSS